MEMCGDKCVKCVEINVLMWKMCGDECVKVKMCGDKCGKY